MISTSRLSAWLLHLLAGMLVLALVLAPKTTTAQPLIYGEPRFDPPALDAMLAPVALYPDPLLSQALMAATYPREVEEAARWLRDHPVLSGDAAVRSADGWDWDPSVRSLLAFPMVLQTLAAYPSWTAELGEAFLVQREDVMEAIQQLRRRALAAGTLRSTEYTRVVDTGEAIRIGQPANGLRPVLRPARHLRHMVVAHTAADVLVPLAGVLRSIRARRLRVLGTRHPPERRLLLRQLRLDTP
jgi:hypothetical protein